MAKEKEALSDAAAGDAAGLDVCKQMAIKVNEKLGAECLRKFNEMAPCDARPTPFECAPVQLPAFQPWMSIRWGDSKCDCIEGDDTEIMCLTICNPYKNLTLANLTVQQITVVDSSGNPVATLPDGSPSIQLVPIGPYCFGDLAPCSCVSRQFVLRLRGAIGLPSKPYRILIDGICFDACIHTATRGCFTFTVCKD